VSTSPGSRPAGSEDSTTSPDAARFGKCPQEGARKGARHLVTGVPARRIRGFDDLAGRRPLSEGALGRCRTPRYPRHRFPRTWCRHLARHLVPETSLPEGAQEGARNLVTGRSGVEILVEDHRVTPLKRRMGLPRLRPRWRRCERGSRSLRALAVPRLPAAPGRLCRARPRAGRPLHDTHLGPGSATSAHGALGLSRARTPRLSFDA